MDKNIRKAVDVIANAVSKIIPIPKNNDLESSLKNAGIDIRYFVDKNYDAFLKWDEKNDCPIIAVNANQSKTRMNFSMAHELGHLIINYGWVPFGDNKRINGNILNIKYRGGSYSDEDKKDETIVNEFAASFLMPNDDLKKIIDDNDYNYQELVTYIANVFEVSPMSAKIRVDNFLN